MHATMAVIRDAEHAAVALHPLRRRILAVLQEPDSATGVAQRLGLPRQRVGYHVRELERQGLLDHVEDRRRGNCTERILRATARHYLIDPRALGAVGLDVEDVKDRFSSTYLVAASVRTVREVAHLQSLAERAEKRLATFTLETEVRFAAPEAQRRFAEELTETVTRLVDRYHDADATDGRTFRFMVGGYPAGAVVRADETEKEGETDD